MSERRGRAYSKKQRSNWRRSEESPRDGSFSTGLKPTAILSKPKAPNEEYNPDFPTLLQANAAGGKKSSCLPPAAPSGCPPPASTAAVIASTPPPPPSVVVNSTKKNEPKTGAAALPEKKRDPLDSLEFPSIPETRLRLVDAKVGFHESGGIQNYLSETNTEFLVVGVIGSKGSGKSSLLNGLIGANIFKESDIQTELRGEDGTQGIDAWINDERVIFLDAQPTLNGSFIKDRLCGSNSSNQGKFFSLLNCYLKKESLGEKESLLLTLFLMNVCHCLIFVQDYVLDPEVLHFLQLAEMLKPSSPTLNAQGNKVEYYPNLVLVHNKLRTREITPKFFQTLSEFYDSVFAQSAFQVYSGISASRHSFFRMESPESSEDSEEEPAYAEFSMPPDLLREKKEAPPPPPRLNLITLNDKNNNLKMFEDLMDYFARVLLSHKPSALTTKTLTERNWFNFASQAWANTCQAITSFNYEFNIAAGGGGASHEDPSMCEFRVFRAKS